MPRLRQVVPSKLKVFQISFEIFDICDPLPYAGAGRGVRLLTVGLGIYTISQPDQQWSKLPLSLRPGLWFNYGWNQRLVTLAFAGSIGMTFVILGCALPSYKVWWPFFVVLFYILSLIPTLVARRYMEDSSVGNQYLELAIFITMGCVVSSFALPIVLARTDTIQLGACYLTLVGNIIVYSTIVGFFMAFDHEDSDYSMW